MNARLSNEALNRRRCGYSTPSMILLQGQNDCSYKTRVTEWFSKLDMEGTMLYKDEPGKWKKLYLAQTNRTIRLNAMLNACSITSWYSIFKTSSIKTIIIPIPDNVLKYLEEEKIILPKECYVKPQEEYFPGEDDCDNSEKEPEFEEFSKLIKNAIDELSGKVFIKTNWHAPQDTAWITTGQLCVGDLESVYLLLKGSTIVKTDLERTVYRNVPHVLALKSYIDIPPGSEFRCFVLNHRLCGICSRSWPERHPYIDEQKTSIMADISKFHKDKISTKFLLSSFVFDVIRYPNKDVKLVDISPLHPSFTCPLAFEWEYLVKLRDKPPEEDLPVFPYIAGDCSGIQPNPRSNYGYPKDIIEHYKNNSNEADSMPEIKTSEIGTDDDKDNKDNSKLYDELEHVEIQAQFLQSLCLFELSL